MINNNVYTCDSCGHEKEIPANWGDHNGEKCNSCKEGQYRKTGEAYDQEWVEEERYNKQQDEEYERRHRHDDRGW